ncbi:MAG: AAA family ATPase [Sulfolobales archaeon]|nr:AAA family ATPase [Sulfolobales archaeon]
MKRPFIASISGKGGSGKTTLTALLLKTLMEVNYRDRTLIVDADPATNLPEALGLTLHRTIGDIVEEFRHKVDDPRVAAGYRKDIYLEGLIYEAIIEAKGYDFIAMGRGEGEGCYCYVNAVLTRVLSKLSRNYDVILMDMEAGLEHISRRTDRHVNTMIVVVDPSIMGLKTAERIKEVVKEVGIEVEEMYVVGNRFPKNVEEKLYNWASSIGYEVAGFLPEDPLIQEYSVFGKPLIQMPSDSPAVKAARAIAKKIKLID